jgi:ribosomal protein L29
MFSPEQSAKIAQALSRYRDDPDALDRAIDTRPARRPQPWTWEDVENNPRAEHQRLGLKLSRLRTRLRQQEKEQPELAERTRRTIAQLEPVYAESLARMRAVGWQPEPAAQAAAAGERQ